MDQPPLKKPIKAPASHGMAWLVQSLALLRAQTGRLLLIALLLQLLLGLTQVPLLGILVVIAIPGLGAGILEAFHLTGQGGQPVPSVLFKPLASRQHNGRLLALGALIFAIGVLSISVLLPSSSELMDEDLMTRIQQGDMDAIAQLDPNYLSRLVLAFMVGVAISGTLSYFTIPLVWFQERKLGAAVTEGLRALIVNWKPFLVLSLGLAALFLPVAIVTGILLELAGAGGLVSFFVMGLIMILLLLFQLTLFGTQYCAFREIFGQETNTESQETPGDDSQLVA